jgi:hypothetical protein
MGKAIQQQLDPVRRRQQQSRALALAAWGLVASAALLLVYVIGRWLAGWQLSPAALSTFALAGPVLGYVLGLVWRPDWRDAAAAVDTFYRLKDRATTALEFLRRPDATKLHQLAVNDAIAHLQNIDARQVVPIRTPRVLPYAIASLAAAVVLLVLTSRPAEVSASPSQPLEVVIDSAERAADELKSLEEFAREEQDAEVQKLVMELKQAIDELKQPGVDLREALAKLSLMQAAVEKQQAQFNIGQVDAQLQAVGEALALSDALAEAGKALAAGQLEKAAEELEKLEVPQLDRQVEKTIKEKLDALAKQMQDSGSSSLGAAAGEISQGLGGDGSKFKRGVRQLSNVARQQSKRKKLNDLLRKQSQCLGECKGDCECEGKTPSDKSGRGGKNWGLGASGNELGEKTPEIGGRYESRLTGKQTDEGEIEIETTHSPEGKQQAQREYRASYDKYRKISEAVLDSEPIPLGHRQTIRRYFEAIRPTDAETDQVQEATKSPAAEK